MLFGVCSCNTSSAPDVAALRFCKALSAGDESTFLHYAYIPDSSSSNEYRIALYNLMTRSDFRTLVARCHYEVKSVQYKGDSLATVILDMKDKDHHETFVPFPMIFMDGEWKVDIVNHTAFNTVAPR